MKTKFSAIPHKVVTFYRGDDSIEFPLQALPLGYREHLVGVFPQPAEFINGVATPKEDPEYWPLLGYLSLARSLKSADLLETSPPGTGASRQVWQAYAEAVRNEFREAYITSGEVAHLLEELGKLDNAQLAPEQRRAVGNG